MRNSVLRVAMESLQGSAEDRKGVRDTNGSLKDKKGSKDIHGSRKDTNRSPKDMNGSKEPNGSSKEPNGSRKEPTLSKDRKRSLKDMKGAHSPNNSSHLPFTSPALQTLFVSATLRIDDSPATKALSSLMRLIACRGNPRIVVSNDTPRESAPSLLPAGLALFSVATAGDREKEEFLFAYGKQYSGRTLVFFNSIRSDGRFVPRRCGETPLRSPAQSRHSRFQGVFGNAATTANPTPRAFRRGGKRASFGDGCGGTWSGSSRHHRGYPLPSPANSHHFRASCGSNRARGKPRHFDRIGKSAGKEADGDNLRERGNAARIPGIPAGSVAGPLSEALCGAGAGNRGSGGKGGKSGS